MDGYGEEEKEVGTLHDQKYQKNKEGKEACMMLLLVSFSVKTACECVDMKVPYAKSRRFLRKSKNNKSKNMIQVLFFIYNFFHH